MKPFFSVIIPTLNEAKYLPKLLSDLSKQTYKGFEVVVADGVSEDGTDKAISKFGRYMDLNILKTGKNNVAYQRNYGAQNSKGKYLIFFDADVRTGETCLEELHLAIIKRKLDLATTWILADSKDTTDNMMILLANLGLELAKTVNKPFACGADIIISKEVFLKLKGFREDLMLSEDHDFINRTQKLGIELTILKEPKVIISLRRFRSEGTLRVLRKYAQAYIYGLLKGPITSQLFDYPMGGHAHQKRNKKLNLMKLDTYLRNIKILEEKLNNILSE